MQPDLDELNVNMEDNEDNESTKSEVKLGKLQFSLDYDFQKGEVSTQTWSPHTVTSLAEVLQTQDSLHLTLTS